VCVFYTGTTGNTPKQTYWFKQEFFELCSKMWGGELGPRPSLDQCLDISGGELENCPESKIIQGMIVKRR